MSNAQTLINAEVYMCPTSIWAMSIIQQCVNLAGHMVPDVSPGVVKLAIGSGFLVFIIDMQN